MKPATYTVRLSNAELKRMPQGVRNALKVKRNRLTVTAKQVDGGAVIYSIVFRWGGYDISATSAIDTSDVKERFINAAANII